MNTMKRFVPFNGLSVLTLLCVGLVTTATFAQVPLPYDAVPVDNLMIPMTQPTQAFSDPGNQMPLVQTAQSNTQVYQPNPQTIPQPLSSGYPPAYSGGAPIVTHPVPSSGGLGGLYDQGYGRSGITTGFAFVFLKPYYNNNNAFVVRSVAGRRDVNSELNWDRELSPRVWMEFVGGDDFGARVTYWQLDQSASNNGFTTTAANQFITRSLGTANLATVAATVGDTINAGSSLNMYTIDAEFTQRIHVQKWQSKIGGGLRNAGIHQRYGAVGQVNGAGYSGAASTRFDGIGPTIFAEFRRPMWQYGFSLIASVRGSLLYGASRRDTTDTFAGVTSSLNTSNNQVVPVGEFQLGAEWSTWVSRTSVFYLQVAWESQYWAGLGNAASTEDDLGLTGFNTTIGLEW